jgi:hypothetical protein
VLAFRSTAGMMCRVNRVIFRASVARPVALAIIAVAVSVGQASPAAAQPKTNTSAIHAVKVIIGDMGHPRPHQLYALLANAQHANLGYAKFVRCSGYLGQGQQVTKVGKVTRRPLSVYGYGQSQPGALVTVAVRFQSGRVEHGRAALIYRRAHWMWFLTRKQIRSCH